MRNNIFIAALFLAGCGLLISGATCSQTVCFQNPDTFSCGPSPFSISTGDFNGDSLDDIVVASFFYNNISVLINNGNGTFGPSVLYNTSGWCRKAVPGDFNNDGNLDIAVVGNFGGADMFIGDGTGNFNMTNYAGSYGGDDAVAGHFDLDNNLDLAMVNCLPDNLTILMGNGAGSFGSELNYTLNGKCSWSLDMGDFNEDGKTDLVIGNRGDQNNNLYNLVTMEGLGNGSFGPDVVFDQTIGGPEDVAVADIDNDGHDDVVAPNWLFHYGTFYGFGNGSFNVPPQFDTASYYIENLIARDINNDGWTDLICGDAIMQIIVNKVDSYGTAIQFVSGTGNPIRDVATGDFNGDGRTDIASCNFNPFDQSYGSVSVFMNCGPMAVPEPIADFSCDTVSTGPCCLTFNDLSLNSPTSWNWYFPGGTPATSTDTNPSPICFPANGYYDATLIVSNATGTDTIVKIVNTFACICDSIPDGLTAIKKKKVRIEIYPNPTSGQFTVTGATAEIQVYDLFGRLVLRSTEPEIDMRGYAKGVYIVKAGQAVRKLVIQ